MPRDLPARRARQREVELVLEQVADHRRAVVVALEKKARGIFNLAGPGSDPARTAMP